MIRQTILPFKIEMTDDITIPFGWSALDNLKSYLYDILQSEWRFIENTTIDLENEHVSARTSHLHSSKLVMIIAVY